jgi:ribosomal protein S6
MKFDGNADCAREIVRQMRLHENIMRALLIRL